MLQTEQNTQAMERRVLAAARARLRTNHLQANFEHGQWWITDLRNGAQYSVVDANTITGFDLEQVSEGDEQQ